MSLLYELLTSNEEQDEAEEDSTAEDFVEKSSNCDGPEDGADIDMNDTETMYTSVPNDKALYCKLCKHTASCKSKMVKHLRIHTGERPFQCPLCSYSAAQGGSLKTHLLTHSGERPHPCPECHVRCTTSSAIRRHILRVHSKNRPFPCTICTYKARSEDELKLHTATHNGEYLKCNYCNFKTIRKQQLKEHVKRHQGKTACKCPVCGYKAWTSNRLSYHFNVCHADVDLTQLATSPEGKLFLSTIYREEDKISSPKISSPPPLIPIKQANVLRALLASSKKSPTPQQSQIVIQSVSRRKSIPRKRPKSPV